MKKQYTAPILTVVTFNVERGYATSVDPTLDYDMRLSQSSSTEVSETRSSSTNWTTSDDDNFWNKTYE